MSICAAKFRIALSNTIFCSVEQFVSPDAFDGDDDDDDCDDDDDADDVDATGDVPSSDCVSWARCSRYAANIRFIRFATVATLIFLSILPLFLPIDRPTN